MKVRVLQIGARKSYAVPEVLASSGNIERLCTDLYFDGLTSRLATSLGNRFGTHQLVKNIVGRRCASLVPEHVVSNLVWGLRNRRRVSKALAKGNKYKAYLKGGIEFSNHYSHLPLGEVDIVYAFSSAALEIFQAARKQGVLCVLDHETAPVGAEIGLVSEVEEEFQQWLPYVPDRGHSDSVQLYADRQLEESQLADIVICPSTFSMEIVKATGVPPSKLCVVPFAAGEHIAAVRRLNRTKGMDGPLRVLFAGNDALRKGLPILVEAFKRLPSEKYEVKAAGNWCLSDYGWNEARSVMETLGGVPRSGMAELYSWADVFVLPTFSDTMGVVILEAMSHGVPVITTTNSGGPDLIKNEDSGFVIRPNSADEIAEILKRLEGDREYLLALSSKARQHSRRFDLGNYGYKLRSVLTQGLEGRRFNASTA